jgi:hypothetical protein
MAQKLRITELDFDQIKTNLKNYLRNQDQFTDYDFEGSGMAVMLDVLAYNTHYNAYYLNMVANEAFIDTAILRDSVVSHAKALGYTPFSTTAPVAIINVTVETNTTGTGILTLPKGFYFMSNLVDGKSYKFVTLEDYTVSKSGTQFVFENIKIYEGTLSTYKFNQDNTSNPKQIITLPDTNLDTSTIAVSVQPNTANTTVTPYNKAVDIIDLDNKSEVFFLQEGRGSNYQLYFGDDVIGKKLNDGAAVIVTYVVTNASIANGVNSFKPLSLIGGFSAIKTTTVSTAAGGAEKETPDEIKVNAPLQYTSQNRLVSIKDYESYLKKNYPAVDSLSIWGGEDEIPKVYGKVFISLKPKTNFFLSEAEKTRITEEILKPKSVVAIESVIRDPEYLYLQIKTRVSYDPKKTTRNGDGIKNAIRNSILIYKNQNLDKFASTFVLSKLQDSIDSSDFAILGSEAALRLEKLVVPKLNTSTNYTVNYFAPLHRGTTTNKLFCSEFTSFDSLGTLRTCAIEEVPESYTGVQTVSVDNPGYKYLSPVITITGDGSGATATATVVNGRIQSINLTNRGAGYSTATVTITDERGVGASATAIVDAQTGELRLVYFDQNAERQIINSNIGTIDYPNGIIQLNNLRVQTVVPSDGLIRLSIEADKSIIKSQRNVILSFDETDPASITTELEIYS